MASKVNRQEVIKKCSSVFIKTGYYGTSMSDLGQACGLEKSHFYYYFKSKDALFTEVLNYIKHETLSAIFPEESKKDSKKEYLKKVTKNTFSFYTNFPLGCFFGKTALDINNLQNEDFNSIIQDYFQAWEKKLYKVYKEYHKKKTAKSLAQLSLKELQGALIILQIDHNYDELEETLKRIYNRVKSND